MQKYQFELFADYYYFYLQDQNATGDLSESWTNDACKKMLAIAPSIIGIGTIRNMEVSVTIEIVCQEPETDLSQWEHVNECDLEIVSGILVVAGCSDFFPDAARISLNPGVYRARVLYGNLNSISSDGLDGDDHYKVILWLKN